MARSADNFQEEWVKRDKTGKFSTVAESKDPGTTPVTNRRTGTQANLVGRTPDGYVVVRLQDGALAKWRPSSIGADPSKDPREQLARYGTPAPLIDKKEQKRAKKGDTRPGSGATFGGSRSSGKDGKSRNRGSAGVESKKTVSPAERQKRAREFVADTEAEIERARKDGRTASMYVGKNYEKSLQRFRDAGLPVRINAAGVAVVGFRNGPMEIRSGSAPAPRQGRSTSGRAATNGRAATRGREPWPIEDQQRLAEAANQRAAAELEKDRPHLQVTSPLGDAQYRVADVDKQIQQFRSAGVPLEQVDGVWYAIIDGRRVAIRGK